MGDELTGKNVAEAWGGIPTDTAPGDQLWRNYRTRRWEALAPDEPFREGTTTDYIPQDEATQRVYHERRLAGDDAIAAMREAMRFYMEQRYGHDEAG